MIEKDNTLKNLVEIICWILFSSFVFETVAEIFKLSKDSVSIVIVSSIFILIFFKLATGFLPMEFFREKDKVRKINYPFQINETFFEGLKLPKGELNSIKNALFGLEFRNIKEITSKVDLITLELTKEELSLLKTHIMKNDKTLNSNFIESEFLETNKIDSSILVSLKEILVNPKKFIFYDDIDKFLNNINLPLNTRVILHEHIKEHEKFICSSSKFIDVQFFFQEIIESTRSLSSIMSA